VQAITPSAPQALPPAHGWPPALTVFGYERAFPNDNGRDQLLTGKHS
jgi:hypothetical protein